MEALAPPMLILDPLVNNTYLKLGERNAWNTEGFDEDLLSDSLAISNLHELPNADCIYIMFGVYKTCSTTEVRKALVNFIKVYEDDLSDMILGFLRLNKIATDGYIYYISNNIYPVDELAIYLLVMMNQIHVFIYTKDNEVWSTCVKSIKPSPYQVLHFHLLYLG